jgi:predicted hotdog family 3-hydroxylacyl-ACP dehydratase
VTDDLPDVSLLVPHAADMVLLERIVSWSATRIHAATTTHRAATNPLRSNGRLRAVHLCEYGAQAMAVHGGLLAAGGGRPTAGYLVILRQVQLARDFVDDLEGELDVSATRIQGSDAGWSYAFTVEHRGECLATGRALVAFARGE